MGVRVEWVSYGRQAAEALRAALGDVKGGEPLAPVAVVVPSNHVGVAARRLLGSGTLGAIADHGVGLCSVTFLTAYRMAELLGSARLAGDGRRPISTPVIAAAVRGALAQDPGVFASVKDHPATQRALVAAYRELRDVSAPSLESLATRSPRAADVVRLHREARAQTEPSWYDEQDLIEAAVGTVHENRAQVRDLGAIVVYLPQRVSRSAGRLLGALSERSDVVVLAGATGADRADAEVSRSVQRIATLSGAAWSVPPQRAPMAALGATHTKIVTASDSDEEVRVAVRAVVDAARGGTSFDRMAILYANPAPYARLVHEQLSAAQIPHNGASIMALTARVAGRTLLGFLALPVGGFRREDVFAWLATARLRRRGRWIPVTAWERISRDAGVVSGRDQWDRRLEGFARRRVAEAASAEAEVEAPTSRAERARADSATALELRAFIVGLIDDLSDASAQRRSWSERVRWARGHLEALLGPESARRDWPSAEQRAVERMDRALDRLAGLDAVESAVELDVFTQTLELELESDLGRVGRMGEGVLVGSVGMGVGLDLDLVAVLGLAEGLLPTPVRDDSLLPDHERRSAGGELPLRSHGVDREHHELLAALAGSARHLLCVPRGDLRQSKERVPSRWAVEAARALSGRPWSSTELLEADEFWLEHVASFEAGLRAVEFPASAQEYRLRRLLADPPLAGSSSLLQVGDLVLAAGVEVLAERGSDRFSRFDGNLVGLEVPSPAARPTSATRLEGWAGCPFAYLLRDVLGVQEVENPEDHLQITPRDRGSLVHDALERFIAEVLVRPKGHAPSPLQPWTADDHERLDAIGEQLCREYEERGLTGRRVFWQRDKRRILADLHRFLRVDSEHRSVHGTRPIAAELAFGLPGAALGPVGLRLPDGRSVYFRGKADRVDLDEGGTLHVIDYKTGDPAAYRELNEDDPDLAGRKLQLAVYGQAARMAQEAPAAPVRAGYWFVSARGGFGRVGYSVTPEVLARVGRSLGKIVTGIERGVFPQHPTGTSTSPWVECPYCDPDGLGVVELRRHFERKRVDPAMLPFVQLLPTLSVSDIDPDLDPGVTGPAVATYDGHATGALDG